MERRDFLKILPVGAMLPLSRNVFEKPRMGYDYGLSEPISIYITWAAHDQLSDNVKLSESLALDLFYNVLKLKKAGIKFDYFLMDMFWFDIKGGFRTFDKILWPNGPDYWLNLCEKNNILPAIWLSTNVIRIGNQNFIEPIKEWENSLSADKGSLCFFSGNFLSYHIETMQIWYNKGVRLYKFDFADFKSAPEEYLKTHTVEEITGLNKKYWHAALKAFKYKNPDVVMLAYNGYGGRQYDTSVNFGNTVELSWLDVFDAVYCGDPRPADVPCHNFWRSKDIYSDHMVFQYKINGMDLKRIDNSSFMIGNTGTCYQRGKQDWKSTLILSLARGGWANTYYGDLRLLDEQDIAWFASVQKLFFSFQKHGVLSLLGDIPGSIKPYGYFNKLPNRSLLTFVNPSQTIQKMKLPDIHTIYELLYFDTDFIPSNSEGFVTIGPEQMVLLGSGVQKIPFETQDKDKNLSLSKVEKIEIYKQSSGKTDSGVNYLSGSINAPKSGSIRCAIRLLLENGNPYRIKDASSAMDEVFQVTFLQNNKKLKTNKTYNKKIWSGLSWISEEIVEKDYDAQNEIFFDLKITKLLKYPVKYEVEFYNFTY